jgi:carbonic anhydrase/acetyltransferase-like protein (isoleucine patch superfamily)
MFHTEFRAHQIHPTVFLAQGAVVVGDVTLAEYVSVWFNATLRGDTDPIMVGARSNIQEGAIFHADPGFPVVVGAGVTIGHGALIHGARIGNRALIGMRAVLLNGAVIGDNSLVGAGSLVPEGKVFPPNVLILGSPAKIVRELSEEEMSRNQRGAEIYVERAQAFKAAAANRSHPAALHGESPSRS